MSDRKSMLDKILEAFGRGEHLVDVDSNDENNDQTFLSRFFRKSNEDVWVAKDPDGGKLWVKKRNGK